MVDITLEIKNRSRNKLNILYERKNKNLFFRM